jgi:hydroxymethylbilane synthase
MPASTPSRRSPAPVVLATRGSPLALWQAERVAALLRQQPDPPPVELLVVTTTGDRRADVSLAEIGGQGVFAKEVQEAVVDGRADAAVHSAKDLPAVTPPGLVLAAVPERADPRDVLVGGRLEELPTGSVVATSSPRRRAQLAWHRPDLRFVEVRGNIDRRLSRPGGADAVVVAAAALDRLGRATDGQRLSPSVVLPQVGQGALAVECRSDDDRTRSVLAAVDDPVAHAAVRAERSFLAAIGGGCRSALAALARVERGAVVLEALLASGDGRVVLRCQVAGPDGDRLGDAAVAALAGQGATLVAGLPSLAGTDVAAAGGRP